MPLHVPNPSEGKLLEFMLGVATPGNQQLCLFTNNITHADDDILADYTEMGAVQGYVRKTLTKTSWVVTPTAAAGAGAATGAYAEQTFAFDGTGGTVIVYGYFVIDVTTGLLLWGEKFSSSKTVANNGDLIKITPQFTLSKV